jgi:hypothetical protein
MNYFLLPGRKNIKIVCCSTASYPEMLTIIFVDTFFCQTRIPAHHLMDNGIGIAIVSTSGM